MLALLAVVFASFGRMPERITHCADSAVILISFRRFVGHPKDRCHVMQSACSSLASRRSRKKEEIQRRRFGDSLILSHF